MMHLEAMLLWLVANLQQSSCCGFSLMLIFLPLSPVLCCAMCCAPCHFLILHHRFVTNKGVERFKIVDVVKEKPVLLCEVEVLDEDDDETEDVSVAAGAPYRHTHVLIG